MDYYGDASVSDDGSAHGDVSGGSLGSTIENAMRKQEGKSSSSSSSKSGGKPAKRESLSLSEQVHRESGPKRMSNKDLLEDVEEAASKVARKNGDPYPNRNGYGKTGARDAVLEPFHAEAGRNGTGLGNAVADYSAIEKAFRQHPSLGIEFIARRLGLDSRQVAYDYAARHNLLPNDHVRNDVPIGTAVGEYASRAEADHAIATLASNPQYEHLTTTEGQQGILAVLNTRGANGQTINEGLMQRGLNAMQRLDLCYREYDRQTMRNRIHEHYNKQRADSEDADRRIRGAARHTI
jgi:hypothetical protein